MSENAYQQVIEYHQRTKHSLQKYADGPETLDWEAQPDPFRRFEGAQRIRLPLDSGQLHYAYAELLHEINPDAQPLTRNSIGSFMQLSLGLSAWKQYGTDRWSVRCNPSSGNLHPTEAYALLPSLDKELVAGVYHYASYDHCLEQRCTATELTTIIPDGSFYLGLSSIYWREAWKYGERAYRYCQLDVGHALAALRIAAAVHGWQLQLVSDYSDAQLASLLGLNRIRDFDNVEKESPDLLLQVSTEKVLSSKANIDALLKAVQESSQWQGRANLLDPSPMYQWPIIDEVSHAATRTTTGFDLQQQYQQLADEQQTVPDIDAVALVKQRRSAQAFDPNHRINAKSFIQILQSTLATTSPHLFAEISSHIDLLVFVHRVDGLDPGLYMLIRNQAHKTQLQELCRKEFDWQRPEDAPESLDLYHLVSANGQKVARSLACHQAIASEGMFSVAMLADFTGNLTNAPWQYRLLHWEAGVIGQMLYLAAEAHSLRGTGMGCFFDDAIHNLLELKDMQYQCLYQFTVGMPVIDSRIVNLPPYEHLQN